MRYVIADIDGKTHASFDRRVEARKVLQEIIDDEPPEALDEFYLAGFDESGVRVFGPQSARAALDEHVSAQLKIRNLRGMARLYQNGGLTRAELLAAVRDATENLAPDTYRDALALRDEIERLASAASTEADLRKGLASFAPSWWALEVKELDSRAYSLA